MKYTTPLLGLVAIVAAQAPKCSKTGNEDNCQRAVIASAFPERSARAACSSYFLTTLVPPTLTETITVTTPTTITEAEVTDFITATLTPIVPPLPSPVPRKRYLQIRERALREARYLKGRSDEPDDVATETIIPNNLPPYVTTACRGDISSRYSSACSCLGVTASTTTLTVPTTTTSVEIPDVPVIEVPTATLVVATAFRATFASGPSAVLNQYVAPSLVPTLPGPLLVPKPEASAGNFVINTLGEVKIDGKLVVAVNSSAAPTTGKYLKTIDPPAAGDPLPADTFAVTCAISPLDNALTCTTDGDFLKWVVYTANSLRLFKAGSIPSGHSAVTVHAVPPVAAPEEA